MMKNIQTRTIISFNSLRIDGKTTHVYIGMFSRTHSNISLYILSSRYNIRECILYFYFLIFQWCNNIPAIITNIKISGNNTKTQESAGAPARQIRFKIHVQNNI